MKTIRFLIIAIVLLIPQLPQLPAHSADFVYPDRPKDVRISGALLPAGAQATEDIVTVNIFLGETPRVLRIGKLEMLSQDEKERAVDEGLLMRQVRFYGADELIARLQQPGLAGKPLVIEGRLDAKERKFLVKSVTEGAGK